MKPRPGFGTGERAPGYWPDWIGDVLRFAPIAELETGWRTAIGDAMLPGGVP